MIVLLTAHRRTNPVGHFSESSEQYAEREKQREEQEKMLRIEWRTIAAFVWALSSLCDEQVCGGATQKSNMNSRKQTTKINQKRLKRKRLKRNKTTHNIILP
jgi:hypothetical protein